MLVAGVDVGNSTTEVAVARLEPGGEPEWLLVLRRETTGAKGSIACAEGVADLIGRAGRRLGERPHLLVLAELHPVEAGLVELRGGRAPGPELLVGGEQLVVREGDELGAAAEVLRELAVPALLCEGGLEEERLSGDAHIALTDLSGEHRVERDCRDGPAARGQDGVAGSVGERVGQLGHDASSSTGSSGRESRRSTATMATTRAW